MDVNEILSAFVDGEPIEPAALAAALGSPGARDVLIDFVRLRAALADESRPSEAFVARTRERLAGRRSHWGVRPRRLAAAVALVALGGVGGLDLGRRLRPEPSANEPPPVSRVLHYEPGVDWNPVRGR